jgi:hypothetical protein
MAVNADQFDVLQLGDQIQHLSELAQVDAKLILLHAGCDFGMRMGVHFRIDTEGDRGDFVLGSCQFIQDL